MNRVTAVDRQDGTGDPAAGVRQEKRDRMGHVLRSSETEWMQGFDAIELF